MTEQQHSNSNKDARSSAQKESGLVLTLKVPVGISVHCTKDLIAVEGKGKSVSRKFIFGDLKVEFKDQIVRISSERNTRRTRTLAGTLEAHTMNLIKGIQFGPCRYQLKICAGHFPMNVSLSGADFIIKNFLGESVPRKIKIPSGVKVKIAGDQITVEADTKEAAGQVAASIEKLTVIKGRDLRIFQDGIYITQKERFERE